MEEKIPAELVEWILCDEKVVSRWRNLAWRLGFSNYIPELEVGRYRTSRNGDRHKLQVLFQIWRRKKPEKYTVKNLKKLLAAEGLNDMRLWISMMTQSSPLVDQVSEIVYRNISCNPTPLPDHVVNTPISFSPPVSPGPLYLHHLSPLHADPLTSGRTSFLTSGRTSVPTSPTSSKGRLRFPSNRSEPWLPGFPSSSQRTLSVDESNPSDYISSRESSRPNSQSSDYYLGDYLSKYEDSHTQRRGYSCPSTPTFHRCDSGKKNMFSLLYRPDLIKMSSPLNVPRFGGDINAVDSCSERGRVRNVDIKLASDPTYPRIQSGDPTLPRIQSSDPTHPRIQSSNQNKDKFRKQPVNSTDVSQPREISIPITRCDSTSDNCARKSTNSRLQDIAKNRSSQLGAKSPSKMFETAIKPTSPIKQLNCSPVFSSQLKINFHKTDVSGLDGMDTVLTADKAAAAAANRKSSWRPDRPNLINKGKTLTDGDDLNKGVHLNEDIMDEDITKVDTEVRKINEVNRNFNTAYGARKDNRVTKMHANLSRDPDDVYNKDYFDNIIAIIDKAAKELSF